MDIIRKAYLLKALDDEGKGTAIIATLNVIDSDGDVTLPGAFGTQSAKLIPAHDWGHVPLGKAVIREEGANIVANFEMNLKVEAAREWHEALKFDMEKGEPLQEWSYGFTITKQSFGEHEGQQVRFIEAVKVHEISPVIAGAGVGTRTLAIKSEQAFRVPTDMLQIKTDQVAERSVKLSDQLKLALYDVGQVVARCNEVREIREKDGRDLSPERYGELDLIMLGLLELSCVKVALVEVLQKDDDPETVAAAASEFARAEFGRTGVIVIPGISTIEE